MQPSQRHWSSWAEQCNMSSATCSYCLRLPAIPADAYRSLLGHLERPSTGQVGNCTAGQRWRQQWPCATITAHAMLSSVRKLPFSGHMLCWPPHLPALAPLAFLQSTPVSQPPASPPAPAGAPEAEAPQASASLDQPQGQGSSLTMRQLQQSEQAGQPARGEEAEVCSPLHHQESISRVSSLGESMLQEAAALCLSDAPEPPLGPAQHTQHAHHQQPGRPPRPPEHPQRPGEPQQPQQPPPPQQQWQGQPEQQALPEPPPQQGSPPARPQSAGTQAAAATAAAWAAAGRAAQQQAQEAQQVQQQAQVLPLGEIEVEPAEPAAPAALAEVTPPRLAKHLPALRLGAHQLGSGGGPGSGGKLGHRLSISTAADTTGGGWGVVSRAALLVAAG